MKAKKTSCGYILSTHFKEINEKLENKIIETKGDIFKIFLSIYDTFGNECLNKEDIEFYKNIFQNLKTSEDNIVMKKVISEEPKKIKDYYEYINTENLKVSSVEELEIVEKILFTITIKAIVMRFKYDSKQEARKEYLKQLEYLKYGILKNDSLGTEVKTS